MENLHFKLVSFVPPFFFLCPQHHKPFRKMNCKVKDNFNKLKIEKKIK